jgi:hypothetical protein
MESFRSQKKLGKLMKKIYSITFLASFFLLLLFFEIPGICQTQQVSIKQMTWGPDYQVYLKMENDTAYRLEIENLFHANPDDIFNRKTEFVYYPVNFEQSYIDSLLNRPSKEDEFTIDIPNSPKIRKTTLWSVMKESIDGGWVHFINCLLYSLETKQLLIDDPLLTRPESNWKPNPMTQSYKRTRNWKYFFPVEQKYAKKEYRIRKKKNQLGDLASIPKSYIDLMMNTSEREYQNMKKNREMHKVACIDLVKLILGSSYLNESQINIVKSRVMTAITKYNANRMPTVLIFDKYEAAVAMSLEESGYKAEKIIFRNEINLSPEEIYQRTIIIKGIIALINEANKKSFQDKLNSFYKQQ